MPLRRTSSSSGASQHRVGRDERRPGARGVHLHLCGDQGRHGLGLRFGIDADPAAAREDAAAAVDLSAAS